MNGLELSRRFYETYGEPMLKEQFPALMPLIAVGLVGSGSECYGYDDELSRDHDFEAGFRIFLPDESVVDRRSAFLLERAYNKLPRSFEGVERPLLSPVGGSRNGPIRTADFYRDKVGDPDGHLSVSAWLTLPAYALGEATNGAVFYDGYGAFSAIRASLAAFPQDILYKRLAGNLLVMAQTGQYNVPRLIARAEREAVALAVHEFVMAASEVLFLLAGRYAPYYKWRFRALRSFAQPEAVAALSELLTAGFDGQEITDRIAAVSAHVLKELRRAGLGKDGEADLSRQACFVNDQIADGDLRNLNLLVAVP